MPQTTADIVQPLADPELDRLDEALGRPEAMADMSLSAADGFIAAMALSPVFVAPREWLAQLFGAFEDRSEEAEIAALAWRRHNEILAELTAGDATFSPLLDRDEDGWPLGEIWAEGFLLGMDLRIDAWSPLLDHPIGGALMLPILALGDPAVMAEIEPRKAKRAREAGRLTILLPKVVGPLQRMSLALREERSLEDVELPVSLLAEIGGQSERPAASAPKAGRNDPCPCGSGLKYKRCCGATDAR